MRTKTKYLIVYLCVLSVLVASLIRLAQAQEDVAGEISESVPAELSQAELDQILAPIALYPDTLLSHILVASTYPLEVIQAARWRAANEDLDEQQALDASESKDWDPSVKALVPFNDLLQRLSEDLDWLQALGSAFLVNESQVLASVQNLRQKAYQQGNLANNEYVTVEQDDDEIIIETVRKEVVYVPYYDTRAVYGNWWWDHHQPIFWHRPIHSVFSAGLYWSIGFNIRPSFYFGGFHWRNRHVVANYHYRRHANRYWSGGHHNRQIVRVRDYPRWNHNQGHRRGAQYKYNGQRFVHKVSGGYKGQHNQQIDKRRILNIKQYSNKQSNANPKRIKQALANQKKSTYSAKSNKISNKQRVLNHQKNQKVHRSNNEYKKLNTSQSQAKKYTSKKVDKYANQRAYTHKQKQSAGKYQKQKNNNKVYKKSTKSNNNRFSSNKQNKARPVNVARSNKNKQR
jgi:hypothetical protein